MSGYNSATFLLSVLEAAVEMGEVDPFEDTAKLYQITPGAVTAGLSVGDLKDMVAEIERLREYVDLVDQYFNEYGWESLALLHARRELG